MLLKNTSIFYGKELDFIQNITLQVTDVFKKIKSNISPNKNEKVIDCEGLVVVPGFVNAHTHIGDSIAKDIALDRNVLNKI